MENIRHNLSEMKEVALYYARQHRCNYNTILLNPNEDGEFDLKNGSTYENVVDSFFEKERPNATIVFKTDDVLKPVVETIDTPIPYKARNIEYKPSNIQYDFFGSRKKRVAVRTGVKYFGGVRIENNDSCPCKSGKKFKNCHKGSQQ